MHIQIHLMLLLIHCSTIHRTCVVYIQIHLMLLLISVYLRNYSGRYYIQIHLMLLLIWMDDSGLAMPGNIQIHLMLLLIRSYVAEYLLYVYSNTSHVTINLYALHIVFTAPVIQIHLMLLLICLDSSSLNPSISFKYISCYY